MTAAITRRAGGKQQYRRAQALAAARDYVFGHLADQHYVGLEPPADQGIHRVHVRVDEGTDGFYGHGKTGGKPGLKTGFCGLEIIA
jgi:phosphatidylethanolamine-binding protein (PEBP) family uncharacterized protein